MVQISSMVDFKRLCQSHIVARLCYFFLFVMIWSLDPKHKRKKQSFRTKLQGLPFQNVFENMTNQCGQQDASMDKHGKEEGTFTRTSSR